DTEAARVAVNQMVMQVVGRGRRQQARKRSQGGEADAVKSGEALRDVCIAQCEAAEHIGQKTPERIGRATANRTHVRDRDGRARYGRDGVIETVGQRSRASERLARSRRAAEIAVLVTRFKAKDRFSPLPVVSYEPTVGRRTRRVLAELEIPLR